MFDEEEPDPRDLLVQDYLMLSQHSYFYEHELLILFVFVFLFCLEKGSLQGTLVLAFAM